MSLPLRLRIIPKLGNHSCIATDYLSLLHSLFYNSNIRIPIQTSHQSSGSLQCLVSKRNSHLRPHLQCCLSNWSPIWFFPARPQSFFPLQDWTSPFPWKILHYTFSIKKLSDILKEFPHHNRRITNASGAQNIQHMLFSIIHFILILTSWKLSQFSRPKDWYILFCLSLLHKIHTPSTLLLHILLFLNLVLGLLDHHFSDHLK